MILVTVGDAVNLILRVTDEDTPTNNPVTGLTATVAIRRLSDDKWYDFVGATWDTIASYAALAASNVQALTDETDGTYSVEWDQSVADASAEREYEMVYEVTAGTGYVGRMAAESWHFEPAGGISGTGTWPGGTAAFNIVLLDNTGGVIPGCPVVIRNSAETALIAGPSATDQDGTLGVEVDAGAYKIRLGPLTGYDFSTLTGTDGTTAGSGHPYAYTVAADGSTLTLTAAVAQQRFDGYTYMDLKTALLGVLKDFKDTISVGNDQLELWIRAANTHVDARLRYSTGVYSAVSVANQRNHSIWDAPNEILEVIYNDGDDDIRLNQVNFNAYLELYEDNDTAGTPESWARWGDKIYLHPTPDTTGDAITIYLYQGAPLLSASSDVPAVPPQYHRAIVDYALSMGFGDLPDGEKAASYYLQKFEMEMAAFTTMPGLARANLNIGVMREK